MCTNDNKNVQQHVGYSQHFTRKLYLQNICQHFPNRSLYSGVHNPTEISVSTGTSETDPPLNKSFSSELQKTKAIRWESICIAHYRHDITTEKKQYSLY